MKRAGVLAVPFTVLAAVLLLIPITAAKAAGENVRRLGAEIAVMYADGRRLNDESLSAHHRSGVTARLRGGLAVLDLLIRAARNDDPSVAQFEDTPVEMIRSALDQGDRASALKVLSQLVQRYPFETSGLLPPDNRKNAQRQAKTLHETYCAACHDDPDLSGRRPAWNLFTLAQNISPAELAARLVIGVRGDSLTGLDNPFRDSEISALISFYRGDKVRRVK